MEDPISNQMTYEFFLTLHQSGSSGHQHPLISLKFLLFCINANYVKILFIESVDCHSSSFAHSVYIPGLNIYVFEELTLYSTFWLFFQGYLI